MACGSEEGHVCPNSRRILIAATASELSNAASKNGASQPNITLPIEMRTWLPESASYGRSTRRTSRCYQSFGVKDGMSKSASSPSYEKITTYCYENPTRTGMEVKRVTSAREMHWGSWRIRMGKTGLLRLQKSHHEAHLQNQSCRQKSLRSAKHGKPDCWQRVRSVSKLGLDVVVRRYGLVYRQTPYNHLDTRQS